YYYDSDSHAGQYLSDRCMVDEGSAKAHIQFTPPMAFSMAPTRGGFRIFGDFKSGALAMAIAGGVSSLDGAVLKFPVSRTFHVPPRKPSVGFAVQGRYLPRDAWKNLGVRHLN